MTHCALRRTRPLGAAVALLTALATAGTTKAVAPPLPLATPRVPVPAVGPHPSWIQPLGGLAPTVSAHLVLLLKPPKEQPLQPLRVLRHPGRFPWEALLPPAAGVRTLETYLHACGLNTSVTGGLVLHADGTLGQVSCAFHTTLVRARTPQGVQVLPSNPPTLPQSLAPLVGALLGLGSQSLPQPAPLVALPSLDTPSPTPNKAGPARTLSQVNLAAAQPLDTAQITGPSTVLAGLEADYQVTARQNGQPLVGYTVEPVVPTGVQAYVGPTGPGSQTVGPDGRASFWLLSGTPASFGMMVLLVPPKDGEPTYLVNQEEPVVVEGPPANLHPYSAQEVNAAYGIQPLLDQGYNGQGVTIGIVIWNRFSLADVRQYFRDQGIPMPRVQVVSVGGPPLPGDGGTEATLDVERAGSAAPGASIVVYDAQSAQYVLDALVLALEQDRAQVLSLSWGIPETDLPDSIMGPLETLLDAAAQEGMTVLVSSGDTGARADGVHLGVSWPASSPLVLAVGGTQLAVGLSSGTYQAESAWSPDGTFDLGTVQAPSSSGGGYSRYYPRPPWQLGPGLPSPSQELLRGMPDVSLAATYPGYATVVDGKVQAYGGTSAGAPTWAGLVADLDQALGGSLGPQLAPLLYAFAAGLDPQVFHPVVTGTNGVYRAGPGWNPVTGLGTPNGNELLHALLTAFTPARITAFLSHPSLLYRGVSAQVTVTVQDAYGIALAGTPVEVTAPPGGEAHPGNDLTDAQGQVSFTIRALTPGIHTFTFTVPAHAGPGGPDTPLTATFTGNFLSLAPPTRAVGLGAVSTPMGPVTVR